MDEDDKSIRLVFDAEKDPEDAVRLEKGSGKSDILEEEGIDSTIYTSFKIQPAVNGGFILFMENTDGLPDLFYCHDKDELLSILNDCLSD